jgi:hypothetical protein
MFNYTHVTDFEYSVETNGDISVPNEHVEKLVEFPALAEEIYHFVSDIAVSGTAYRVYLEIVRNVIRVKVDNRTVFPQV